MRQSVLTLTHRIKQYRKISWHAEQTLPKRLKFLVRSVFHSKYVDDFANVFESYPYKNIASNHPEIYRRIFRRYISTDFTVSQRVHYLLSHFQVMTEMFCNEWVDTIYNKNLPVRLLEIPIDDNIFFVDMCYNAPLGGEGGLVLILLDASNTKIYSTSLSLVRMNDNKLHVTIGGLQGPRPTEVHSQEIVKIFTKKMYGLRPMNFMIFIVREFSKTIGADILEGIATKYHAGHSLNHRRVQNFKADYDKYWIEEGGTQHGSFFVLPLEEQRKEYEEIKSNKRSMYTKRYALLDQISEAIKIKLKSGFKS